MKPIAAACKKCDHGYQHKPKAPAHVSYTHIFFYQRNHEEQQHEYHNAKGCQQVYIHTSNFTLKIVYLRQAQNDCNP
jgi:hypothetical protein